MTHNQWPPADPARFIVLEAFDQLSVSQFATRPIEVRRPRPVPTVIPDSALARPTQPQSGDVGAVLAAILKTMNGEMQIRHVRLAAALILEPRLLISLLTEDQALEWRRRVGAEADPLPGNVAAFATRNNTAWGIAVQNQRANGRLIEDLSKNTWAPGAGLEAVYTAGWPDGRAGFVLEALTSIDLSTAEVSLPDEIQRWIADAAAA